jgi:hypothetical protein
MRACPINLTLVFSTLDIDWVHHGLFQQALIPLHHSPATQLLVQPCPEIMTKVFLC